MKDFHGKLLEIDLSSVGGWPGMRVRSIDLEGKDSWAAGNPGKTGFKLKPFPFA